MASILFWLQTFVYLLWQAVPGLWRSGWDIHLYIGRGNIPGNCVEGWNVGSNCLVGKIWGTNCVDRGNDSIPMQDSKSLCVAVTICASPSHGWHMHTHTLTAFDWLYYSLSRLTWEISMAECLWCLSCTLAGWPQTWKTWSTQGFLQTWKTKGILCNLRENF